MCGDAYPKLAELVDPDNPNTRVLPAYQNLRDHVVELARQDVTTEITALHANGDSMDLQVKSRKKENILVKLKRLLPGGATGIGAMADSTGEVTDDPKRIGDLLCEHWAKVFGKQYINREILETWLTDEFGSRGNVALPPPRDSHSD